MERGQPASDHPDTPLAERKESPQCMPYLPEDHCIAMNAILSQAGLRSQRQSHP
jgi:hypothetical protein